MSKLKRLDLHASDGFIGWIRDFYFDDRGWSITHVLVQTSPFFFGRMVQISPDLLETPVRATGRVPIKLRHDQVRRLPGVDSQKSIPRRLQQARPETDQVDPQEMIVNPHIRGAMEICGNQLHLMSGTAGRVVDLLIHISRSEWRLRALVIQGVPRRRTQLIQVPLSVVQSVSWLGGYIRVGLTIHEVRRLPVYDPDVDASHPGAGKLEDCPGGATL